MTLNNHELSTVFSMLCYLIYRNEKLTDSELALYHRLKDERGFVDTMNKGRNLMEELSNV